MMTNKEKEDALLTIKNMLDQDAFLISGSTPHDTYMFLACENVPEADVVANALAMLVKLDVNIPDVCDAFMKFHKADQQRINKSSNAIDGIIKHIQFKLYENTQSKKHSKDDLS